MNTDSSFSLVEILRNALEDFKKEGKTQADLAAYLEISPGYFSELLKGKKAGSRKAIDIAKKLGVKDISKFYKYRDLDHISLKDLSYKVIPVISWVHAGLFQESVDMWPAGVSGAGDHVPSFVNVSLNAFALKVVGDSMEPDYKEGDIIIVDPMAYVNPGDKCIVKINEDVSFKLMKERNDAYVLVSLNRKYPDQIVWKNSEVEFKVIGKVVGMWRS